MSALQPYSGELFAGTGMLGRAVGEVFGTRPRWFCEFEAAPSKVLAHHHPDVPNYGDVTKVDFRAVPHTHVRAGGFPCQDVSVSGARAGMRDGTRSGLWSEFARSIAEDRPDWVVIENVGGLLSAEAHSNVEPCPWCLGDAAGEPPLRALGAVLADLASLGFDAEWVGIRASEVGAPHGRLRVFILAWPQERTGTGARNPVRPRAMMPAAGALLPTPAASNPNERESADSWLARYERNASKAEGATRAGMPLAIAVQLLPTPTTMDAHASGGSTPQNVTLTDAVVRTKLGTTANPRHLLPTPRASDWNTPNPHGEGGLDLRTAVSLLPTPVTQPETGNGHARNLGGEVRLLPTPDAYSGARGGSQHPQKRRDGGHTVSLQDVAEHEWGEYSEAVRRWEDVSGVPAPSPRRADGKGGRERLNPELPEWMMGWPRGYVTSPDIGISRDAQLRCIGNGVCPQQAVAALHILLARPGVPSIEWGVAA